MDMETISLSCVTNGALQECIAKFNEEQGVDGVKATLSTTEAGLVITLCEGENKTVLSITDVPEIDPPGTEATEEAAKQLDELSEKLVELAESLKSQAKTPSVNDVVDGIGSALFDIYSMIMLLLEVAQQQKKVATGIRMQTHEAKAALMQSQADSIRAHADEAFRLGLASAIVQSVMTVGSAVMVGISVGYTISDVKNSGALAAKKDLKTAQDQLKSLQEGTQTNLPGLSNDDMEALGLPPKNTEQENLEAFKNEFMKNTVEAEKNTAAAKTEMDTKVGEEATAKETLKGAQHYQNECEGKVADAEGKVLDARQKVEDNAKLIAEKSGEIETLEAAQPKDEAAITKAKDELAKLESDKVGLVKDLNDAVKIKDEADQNLAGAVKAKNDAQTTLDKAQDAALEAKGKYGEACAKQIDATKQDLAKISDDLKVQTKGAETGAKNVDKQVGQKNDEVKGDDVKAGEQEIELQDLEKGAQKQEEQRGPDLKKVQEVAQQVEGHNKGKFDVKSGREGLEAKVNDCRTKLDKAWNQLGNTESGKYAAAFKAIGDVLNQVSSAVNSFMDAFKEKTKAEGEAERKITDTEIESKSATQEEASDLIQSATEEINKLLQMLQELTQSMKQVQRDIFG